MKRIAGLLAAGMLLAGCGGGKAETLPVATTPLLTTATPVTDRAETLESAGAADLSSKLLTVEDLPTGWSIGETDDSPSNDCGSDLISSSPVERATVTFVQGGGFGPVLVEVLARFDDGDQAFDQMRKIMGACPTTTSTDGSGNTVTYTYSSLSFPKIGDATFASHVAVSGTFPYAGNIVIVREGDVLAMIVHAGLVAVDAKETEGFVREAASKV